ncbi:MAG: putative zinc-binding metallopeptidase, partial [Pirellulales bacterium]
MPSIFETIAGRLLVAWKSGEPSGRKSAFACRCGRPVYFRNSLCLACKAPLGFETDSLQVRPLKPAAVAGKWTLDFADDDADGDAAAVWKRCANFESPAGCNWLVRAEEEESLCRSCRLNRTIPNLDDADNCEWWRRIENAKRRLVSQLLSLGLPVETKESDDAPRGLMFDFLRSPANGPRVLTGHDHGLITLNVEEADDSVRERTRHEMREPYRTLLGHFRH